MNGIGRILGSIAAALAAILLSVAPLQAQEPIVIGVPTSLGFIEGSESLNAVNMAVEEINDAGGVNVDGQMRPFRVESIDLRDAAAGVPVPEALRGLEKIILEENPAAIVVGPFRSEALMAGFDIISKHRVPMLGTIAMTPATLGKIKENPEKYKYIFRVSGYAISFVGLLAGGMQDIREQFGFDKVYIINQDVLWARGTVGAMKANYFEKTGWEIVGHDQYPTGATDFSSSMRKAKLGGAQVIFPVFDMPESGILVKQWKSQQVPALIAGFISPMAGGKAWDTFDRDIGYLMNAVVELGNIPSENYPPARQFFRRYEQKFGSAIQSGHAPAPSYDSVYILKEAIERAGTTEPDALVAALEKTERQGVVGHIRFNPVHQAQYGTDPEKEAAGVFFQWTSDGNRRIVYPPKLAEGEITKPPWMQ